jgi:prevent-host-death family protein
LALPLAEAKNHLSALVARAEQGEEIAITGRGVPVARLVPELIQPHHTVASER